MKAIRILIVMLMLIVTIQAFSSGENIQDGKPKPSTTQKEVSLNLRGEIDIFHIKLENTRTRSITYSEPDPNPLRGNREVRYTLNDDVKGVIWKITVKGKPKTPGTGLVRDYERNNIKPEEFSLQDEKGQKFTLPVSSTTLEVSSDEVTRIFYAVGPEDSKSITVKAGNSSVEIQISQ